MSLVLDGTLGVDLIKDGSVTSAKIVDLTIQPADVAQKMTLMTAQNSTSGTSIDFTGIPSWAKKITVMFSGVSTNGTSNVQIQIGAGSVTTSGYASNAGYMSNTSVLQAAYTAGFVIVNGVTAAFSHNGCVTISLLGSNTWCQTGSIGIQSGGNAIFFSAGSLALAGILDRIRITTVNGTDTFDAGSINIMYEG